MNELKVFNFRDVDVVDSRDVAQMVGRSHNELLKSIRTYQQYLAEGNFPTAHSSSETATSITTIRNARVFNY